jgi:hypothetical protein
MRGGGIGAGQGEQALKLWPKKIGNYILDSLILFCYDFHSEGGEYEPKHD